MDEGESVSRKLRGSLAEAEGRALQEKVMWYRLELPWCPGARTMPPPIQYTSNYLAAQDTAIVNFHFREYFSSMHR